MRRWLILMSFLMVSAQAVGGSAAVHTVAVKGEFDAVYKRVYETLEANRFWVVFEPDIGANLLEPISVFPAAATAAILPQGAARRRVV